MPLSSVTITLDLADKVGDDFDTRRTKAWATTNVDVIHDTEGNKTRVGSGNGDVSAEGVVTWDVWVPGAGSNPASWQTTFHVDVPDRNAHGGRKRLSFGPYTITAAANIDDLADEQDVPPTYLTTLTQELDAYRDDAANSAAVAQSAAELASAITGLDNADDAITVLDANPASDFRQQQDARLSATIDAAIRGGGSAPVAVGARAGRFDSSLSLYLPTGANLDSIRARLQGAYRKTERCHVGWIGTSIVAGHGSVAGTSDAPAQLRDLLTPRYGAVGGVAIGTNGNAPQAPDSRYTISAGWTFAGGPRLPADAGGNGNIQLFRRASATGQTITYASDTAGTVATIYTFGNSLAFQYSIDGGAPVTVTPTGGNVLQAITVTGLANTTHSITVTTTTAGNYTYVLGMNVRQVSGLEVSNFGYYGAVTLDWKLGEWYDGPNTVEAIDPDMVLIQLGANEAIHGYTTATLSTNLSAIVAQHIAAGRDVVLVVDPPIESGTVTTWSAFRSVIYNVSDTYAVPLIDFTHSWGSRAEGVAAGYYSDQWHPTPAGSGAMALAVVNALTLGY